MSQFRVIYDTVKQHFVALTSFLSAKEVLAENSAVNYAPEEVDSEGTDKVSAHLKGLDIRIGQIVGGSVVFENFDVGAGGQSEFQLASNISSNQIIDVHINGRRQREGDGYSWERDSDLDKIIFSETIPEGSWVEVALHGTPFNLYDYASDVGGQTVFSIPNLTSESILGVWIDGTKQREGSSYAFTRQTGQITFTETVPEGSWVHVQVR